MSDAIALNCILKEEGLGSYFGIKINKNERISVLKEAIWEKTKKKYDIDAISLELWRVDLPFDNEVDKEKFHQLKDENLLDGRKLEDATIVIEKEFGMSPIEGNIHIVIDKPVYTANNLEQSMTQLMQKIDERFQEFSEKLDERFQEFGKKLDERFQEFGKKLEDISEEMRNISEEMRNISEEMRNISTEMRNISKEMRNISTELRELKEFTRRQNLHVTLHELCFYDFVEKDSTLIYERSIRKPLKKHINCRCKVEDVIKDDHSKKFYIMVKIDNEIRRIDELADLSKWVLNKEEIGTQVGNINPHKYFRAENENGSLGTAYDYYRETILDQ